MLQAEEKGWAVFSISAAQPVINDNRRDKGLRCNSLKFCSGKRLPRSMWKSERTVSEGAWEALFATSEANSPMILSLCRASKLLPGKPWGLPAVLRHLRSDVNVPFAHPPATRNSHLGDSEAGMTGLIKAGKKYPSMIQNI